MKRDEMWSVVPAAAACVLLAAGCAQTVEIQTWVLDAELEGSAAAPPVHVTPPGKRNSITISPSISFGPSQDIVGDVTDSSPQQAATYYPIDTLYAPDGSIASITRSVPEHNLRWALPSYNVGLDIDIAWQTIALSAGVNVDGQSGSTGLGFNAAVGLFDVGEELGVRFDAGVQWRSITYAAQTVVITTIESTGWPYGNTSEPPTVEYYDDRDTRSRLGYFAALTLNSVSLPLPFQLFVQVGLSRQTLFDFEPVYRATNVFLPLPVPMPESSGGEAVTAVTWLTGTPGIYVDLATNVRIVAGARVMTDLSGSIASPGVTVIPFAQVDVAFGM